MALPRSPSALAKLAFYRRKRRRKLQDQKDFEIAGFTPATPFDFGATALVPVTGADSANALTLPADANLVLEINAATVVGDIGITDSTTGITYFAAEDAAAGAPIVIRKLFREPHQVRLHRGPTGPAGSVSVSFRGPKDQDILTGTGTFS